MINTSMPQREGHRQEMAAPLPSENHSAYRIKKSASATSPPTPLTPPSCPPRVCRNLARKSSESLALVCLSPLLLVKRLDEALPPPQAPVRMRKLFPLLDVSESVYLETIFVE